MREKLGQKILRQTAGHWRSFENVRLELEKIVKENAELNGQFPTTSWLSEHHYIGLLIGIMRNHGGYVKVKELLRGDVEKVGSLLEEYVNGE